MVVGSNKRGARTLHGHTHSHDVLSAGAGLAAQYLVQGAAHLHGHTQEHDVLSAGAGLAAQYSRRSDAAQSYTMPAVQICALPRHATDSLLLLLSFACYPLPSLRSLGHSACARRLFFPRGVFLGAVPHGPLEQTPQHQPAVEAEPPPSYQSPFCFGEKLGSIWGYS